MTVSSGPDQYADWVVLGAGGRGLFIQHEGYPTPIFESGAAISLCWNDAQGRVLMAISGTVRDSDEQGVRVQLEERFEGAVPAIQTLIRSEKGAAGATPSPTLSDRQRQQAEIVSEQIRLGLGPRIRRLLVQAESGLDQIALGTMIEIAGIPARMALEQLHAARGAVASRFQEELLHPWKLDRTPGSKPDRGFASLQLLDDDAMQIFLKRSESARKLERSTQKSWQELRLLLASLSTSIPELDPDALNVESILEALTSALGVGGLEPGMQQFLLRLSGHAEILDLDGFYQTLSIELQRSGVRPANSTGDAGSRKRSESSVSAAGTVTPITQQRTTDGGGDTGATPSLRRRAQVVSAFPRPAPTPAPSPASAISAARTIWQLGKSSANATPARIDVPILSDQALLDALREMTAKSASSANAVDFSHQLQETAARLSGQADARIDDRQMEAVDLMARLQQAIERDPLLPQTFRRWSRPLLAPILATQFQPEGLAESGESLRQLFALLEFGSVLCSERNDAGTRQIGESIDRIVGSLQGSERLVPEQLSAACEQLETLLRRQRKAGHAIEERVVDACTGQQRLVEARQVVQRELAVRFGGREVPEALSQLVEQRLSTTMVLTLLRHGADSDEWRQLIERVEELDQSLRQAREGQPIPNPELQLAWLRDSSLAEGSDAAALPSQLESLAEILQGVPGKWVRFDHAGLGDSLPRQEQSGAQADPGATSKQLDLLQRGDWLAFSTDTDQPRLLKLAWLAPDRSRFVFVNQLGHRADDLRREDLAAVIKNGGARIVDQGDANVIERAWRHMMEGMHDQLAEQSTHDSLTGLFNRKELDRRLQSWTGAPERKGLSILWIGVDHLRLINQSQGMAAGDRVLCEVATTLARYAASSASGETCCARIAGDEFAVVLWGTGSAAAQRIALSLLNQLNALDLPSQGSDIRVSVSMGLVQADESCTSAEKLLADAERACRAAKDSGRGRLYVHQADDTLLSQMRESLDWVGRVEQSLKTQSLMLYGQRAASLSARAQADPDYLEILLRMRTEDGIALPGDFIMAAERYGQILTLDRFVLQELTRTLRDAGGNQRFRIAFNVSARNIVDPGFIEEILDTLQQQPYPMSQLCVELTETAAIAQLAEATVGMQRLADSGLSMVLDDFGSGWSSYQYLRRLPFDVVKVDGTFIKDIAHSAEDRAMARSINEIAHLLGKRTVAEHVEDSETLEHVKDIGFDYAQGYFLGRPAPLGDFLD